jgi:hypothetical protein
MMATGCENSDPEILNMTFKIPVYRWRHWLNSNTCLLVEEGQEPNWFHRKMQSFWFGFKWEKIDG